MSVITIEIVGSQSTKMNVDAPTQDLLFIATGSDDMQTVLAQVETDLTQTITVDSFFFGTFTLVLQEYEVKHRGNGTWDGTAKYGRRIPRQTGDVVLTFDGTGGTAHISTSMATTSFSTPGTPPDKIPDYNNVIGVNNDQVAGVDITVPVCKITFEYYPAVADMTQDYIDYLINTAGSTNDDEWMGCDAHTVLFLGASGQPRGLDDWALLLHFVYSPNVEDLTIGDISGIQKDGHEYIWIQYVDELDAFYGVKVPGFAYVETVYGDSDFSQFGIGTDLAGILAGSILP
jgi:hypothetical protein